MHHHCFDSVIIPYLKPLWCYALNQRFPKNRFVIELIAAYIDSLNKAQQEVAFIEKIRLMFREEIADISVVAPEPKKTTTAVTELTDEQKVENAASVLDDLEMFG